MLRNSLRKPFPWEKPSLSPTSPGLTPSHRSRSATAILSRRNHNFGGTPTSLPKTSCTYLPECPSASESSPTRNPHRTASPFRQSLGRPSANSTSHMASSRAILIFTYLLIVHEICGKIHPTIPSHILLDMPKYHETPNTAPNCTGRLPCLWHIECIVSEAT
jgi:hypothetical protein